MPARRHSPKGRVSTSTEQESSGLERLQKVLAAAGIGSRRDCEELIVEGRVEVDGKIVQELGTRVDPLTQRIRVDGTTLPTPKRVYYMLNKPTGVLCTNNDPSGRARAVDLIRSNERLFTVGRLDQASEGLIILTNDGELANKLTHPRYGVEKVYRVRVAGTPEPGVLGKLKQGIHFADGFAKVSDVRVKSRQKHSTDLEIVLNEGRNREIRRLLARIGHKVVSLTRIALGPLRLAELPSGAHRTLTRDEVKALRNAVPAPGEQPARSTTRKSSRGRVNPSRPSTNLSGKPSGRPASKPKAHTRSVGSSKDATARPKAKPRPLAFTDQPRPGAILGGDDVPEVKKPAKAARVKKAAARKFGSKKSGGGRPPKKGRR
ncbi:MAG: rRNA pseudouridine synthase [Planctomycetaceae bacterium]|nr:rRNA pseudouridine synthase [Planctomycetales bacterium]MCB9874733.1 rRNA pseudouridine synthase [Planctomycetaceae bacterium]MCB9941827.1 rRNA pseudouridine synthase [Planctomycetaceae bacterium]